MELTLSFDNIEELIFQNKNVYTKLDHYKEIFIDYKLGIISPEFKPLKKNAVTRLCMILNNKDLEIISEVLGTKLKFSMDFKKIFTNISSTIDNLHVDLPEVYNIIDITIYRNKEQVEVTIWN